MKSSRPLQQCTALLKKDGSRCGKYCKPGEVFCQVHSQGYVPKGAAVPKPKVMTHEERLAKFAQAKDPRVAMQAMTLLDKRRGNDGDPRAARQEDRGAFIRALTDEEGQEFKLIMDQFKAFREKIWARRPDLRPDWAPPCQPE